MQNRNSLTDIENKFLVMERWEGQIRNMGLINTGYYI